MPKISELDLVAGIAVARIAVSGSEDKICCAISSARLTLLAKCSGQFHWFWLSGGSNFAFSWWTNRFHTQYLSKLWLSHWQHNSVRCVTVPYTIIRADGPWHGLVHPESPLCGRLARAPLRLLHCCDTFSRLQYCYRLCCVWVKTKRWMLYLI